MRIRFEFPDGRVAVIEGDDVARVEVVGTDDDLTASVSRAKAPPVRDWSVLKLPEGFKFREQPIPSAPAPQHELKPLDQDEDYSPTVVS